MTHTPTTDTSTTDTAFYTPPVPGHDHRPGDILRLRPTPTPRVRGAGPAWQVLYASRGSHGEPIPVSGTVVAPETTGDLGGRPMLVYHPSFHGLGGNCAPSRLLAAGDEPDTEQIGAVLARGWCVAVVDGEGLGVLGHGPHTFLAARAGGQVMLDMGRAAHAIPALNAAGDAPVLLWGYADGGRAAVRAGELHQDYAPELDLRGVAAGAVITHPGEFLRALDGGPFSGIGVAGLLGLSHAYRHLPLRHVLTAPARRLLADAQAASAAALCRDYRHPLAAWCERPVWDDPLWRYVFAHELTGASPAPAVPVHLYHGSGDAIVPVEFGRRLHNDYRAHGAQVSWREFDADHVRTATAAIADVLGRLAEALTRRMLV